MLDVAVVMPVYNERGCITQTLRDWTEALAALAVRYRMVVLNDGSTDGTADLLAPFAKRPEFEIVHQPNRGHGPTILGGYRRAVGLAEWVFQCDSDAEMPASHFVDLWNRRGDYDGLFGDRRGRRQGLARKIISAGSRLAVRCFFGRGVRDVNVPYRLMRSACLAPIVEQIPDDTFAPNLIVSGVFSRANLRVANIPVPHRPRRTGTVSVARWGLWRAVFRSFWQTYRRSAVLAAGMSRPIGKPARPKAPSQADA